MTSPALNLDEDIAPRRRVYVEWLDSYTSTGWRDVDVLDADPLTCYSLGYLIRDTADGIVVAAHLGGDEASPHQVCGAMTIPRAAILRLEELPTLPFAPAKSSSSFHERSTRMRASEFQRVVLEVSMRPPSLYPSVVGERQVKELAAFFRTWPCRWVRTRW